jgi:hypothetical protein
VRTGVLITRTPWLAKTASKAAVNFESRSRIRIFNPSTTPLIARFRACCATHPPLGLRVTPARCTRRVSSSIKEEDVDGAEAVRIDAEEVAGQHAGCLCLHQVSVKDGSASGRIVSDSTLRRHMSACSRRGGEPTVSYAIRPSSPRDCPTDRTPAFPSALQLCAELSPATKIAAGLTIASPLGSPRRT